MDLLVYLLKNHQDSCKSREIGYNEIALISFGAKINDNNSRFFFHIPRFRYLENPLINGHVKIQVADASLTILFALGEKAGAPFFRKHETKPAKEGLKDPTPRSAFILSWTL